MSVVPPIVIEQKMLNDMKAELQRLLREVQNRSQTKPQPIDAEADLEDFNDNLKELEVAGIALKTIGTDYLNGQYDLNKTIEWQGQLVQAGYALGNFLSMKKVIKNLWALVKKAGSGIKSLFRKIANVFIAGLQQICSLVAAALNLKEWRIGYKVEASVLGKLEFAFELVFEPLSPTTISLTSGSSSPSGSSQPPSPTP